MEAMKADHEFAVQGAVRVLKELSRDLTDSQVLAIPPPSLAAGAQHSPSHLTGHLPDIL